MYDEVDEISYLISIGASFADQGSRVGFGKSRVRYLSLCKNENRPLVKGQGGC